MTVRDQRQPLHRRTIDHQTWLHRDGTLEIETRLVDTRGYDSTIGFERDLPAGQPVHDMSINMLIEPDLTIKDIALKMPHTPFKACSGILSAFKSLRGESIGKGWNSLLSRRFKGNAGCRHLVDMLRGMATVVFQAGHKDTPWTKEIVDGFADSCYAFRRDGEVIPRLEALLNAKPFPTRENATEADGLAKIGIVSEPHETVDV